jgi:catechol 2,3-dioxygenase-like lactoylglutathione lyase family enzyme
MSRFLGSLARRWQRSQASGARPRRSPASPGDSRGRPEARGGIPVTGVNELVLEVDDLERAVRFYTEVLGLPLVERWDDRDAAWVMAGERTRIGLWRPQVGLAGGRGGSHVHYALHLPESEYEGAVGRLRSHGQEVQEEVFGPDRGRAVYVTDPDGHVVELWTWDVAGHLG